MTIDGEEGKGRKKMEDEVSNPEAFLNSLLDRIKSKYPQNHWMVFRATGIFR